MVLVCCTCGDRAPAKRQWYNRDHGFGLCGRCATWLKTRRDYDPGEFQQTYGHEGIHWIAEKGSTPNGT